MIKRKEVDYAEILKYECDVIVSILDGELG